MTREAFYHELDLLRERMVSMGSMVDKAVARAMDSLTHQDVVLARRIIQNDVAINEYRWATEDEAFQVIATQAPLAGDLRLVLAAISIATDLERMADHAVGIAKVVIDTADEPPLKRLDLLQEMADISRRMLSDSMTAFIQGDIDAAMEIIQRDDVLDSLYKRFGAEMIDSMLAKSGLTIDDWAKAFKGDFLIAGMTPSQMPDTGKVKPDIFFVTTIGDMGAFMKVIGKLGINKDSSGGMLDKMKAGFTLRNNTLVIGSKGKTDAFFSTNNSANLHLVSDLVRNNAFSLVIDIKALSALIKASNANPSQKTQQMMHFISALDQVTYAAGNYQNGQTEYYFEIKMTDASENSLRSLFKLIHG